MNGITVAGQNMASVYGRWRVGKTFPAEQVFKDKMTFQHAGLSAVERIRWPMGENSTF